MSYTIKHNLISFSVTSNGLSGKEWITRLESKGFHVGDYAKSLLRSDDFKPTNGVTTEIAILKGMFFEDDERITKNIRSEANRREWITPNAEIACLIREMFTDEEIEDMGLWAIIAMHKSIKDSDGNPNLLSVYRIDDGRWLDTTSGYPDDGWWDREYGFAFAVSQVSTKSLESQPSSPLPLELREFWKACVIGGKTPKQADEAMKALKKLK